VVVCGESLIDFIQQPDGAFIPVPGGSPKNTAIALARLGVPTALVSRVGTDRFGDLIHAQLQESGVDLSLMVRTAEPTTLAIASLDAAGAASYSFYINGCADGSWSVEGLPDNIGDPSFCVVAGSLALATPAMADALQHLLAREARAIIVLDPNIRRALIRNGGAVARRLDHWIAMSTIIKTSSEDLEWRHPGEPTAAVAQRWLETGPSLVVVTHGGGGAEAFTANARTDQAAPAVEVVDTVGAGDTLTAGLVEWLLRSGVEGRGDVAGLSAAQLDDGVAAAVALATDTCTRRGADPPWRRAR